MFGCQPHIIPLLWPLLFYKLLHHKLILKARSVQKPWSPAVGTPMSGQIEITGLLRRHLLAKMVWTSWKQIPPQQRCSCTGKKKRQNTHNEPTVFSVMKVLDSQTTGLRPNAVPHFQCPSETWCECCLFETSDSKRETTERETQMWQSKRWKNIHPDRSSRAENQTYKLKVPYTDFYSSPRFQWTSITPLMITPPLYISRKQHI